MPGAKIPHEEVLFAVTSSASSAKPTAPPFRRVRIFAFDPSLSRLIETHDINEVTVKLPWDKDLGPGPVDDYLEVVDHDPASEAFYAPVDLNDPFLLAQDGVSPSEGDPQFHQQMAYAVARTTIRHFEQALGRRILWSPRRVQTGGDFDEQNVEQLRVYPHAFRDANAYYSSDKKALLFGYFPASGSGPGCNMPGEPVFTCLSHDIVAHETTHALLDGLHPRFIEPSNVDASALHEAFADIVALFQHFTYPEVLKHQIAKTRGNLAGQNLLGELAQQFGQAIGSYGALRSAIGKTKHGKWTPIEPDPQQLLSTTECHSRGAVLVAAVFGAFLTIYKRRIADLLRIATGGTGILPAGDLHPDLVNRLAQEAAKASGQILRICIRAMDYSPPVDADFGDYLRALITADADLVSDDRLNYRLAFIESFRQWGIYPRDVRNLSEQSLMWEGPNESQQEAFRRLFCPDRKGNRTGELIPDWTLSTDRARIYDHAQCSRKRLHEWLRAMNPRDAARLPHIVLSMDDKTPRGIYLDKQGLPALEIHSVRPAHRVGSEGQTITTLVVEMTQRRRGYLDKDKQTQVDEGKLTPPPEPDFIFRGGCTVLIDPEKAAANYCIYKRILSEDRLDRMRGFLLQKDPSFRVAGFGDVRRAYYDSIIETGRGMKALAIEPFAMIHRSYQEVR